MLEPPPEALERACQAIALLARDYDRRLPERLAELRALVAGQAWREAARLAHDLAGEAGTLGWPLVSTAAKSLRCVLEGATGAKRMAAVELHMASLWVMVAQGHKGDHPEGQRLAEQLIALSPTVSGGLGADR